MIHYIDQTSERDHHMVFNSSILRMLVMMYPGEQIVCHGIFSNQQSIKQLLDKETAEKIRFEVIEYTKPASENKFLKVLNYIKKEKKRKKIFKDLLLRSTDSDILFLSITTFSSFLTFKKMKVKFSTPTIAVLHGDLDFVYNAKTKVEKLMSLSYKKNFKIKAPNFYYLLLNKISKEYLMKDGYLKISEILEIDHPHNMLVSDIIEKDIAANSQISFGHIGSMEVERKNSHYIYHLAEKFNEEVSSGQVSFQAIGLITAGVIPYKNKWVTEAVGNLKEDKPDYLSREAYESKLQQLDYSLFFYDVNQYIFRTSGAIIDAIATCTPFVVLKHPIFDYIFNEAGNVGFQCENLDEMETVIKKIISKDEEMIKHYKMQVLNLMKIRQKLSVEGVADDLKKQLAKIKL